MSQEGQRWVKGFALVFLGWSLRALTTEDTKLHKGRPKIFDHS